MKKMTFHFQLFICQVKVNSVSNLCYKVSKIVAIFIWYSVTKSKVSHEYEMKIFFSFFFQFELLIGFLQLRYNSCYEVSYHLLKNFRINSIVCWFHVELDKRFLPSSYVSAFQSSIPDWIQEIYQTCGKAELDLTRNAYENFPDIDTYVLCKPYIKNNVNCFFFSNLNLVIHTSNTLWCFDLKSKESFCTLITKVKYHLTFCFRFLSETLKVNDILNVCSISSIKF